MVHGQYLFHGFKFTNHLFICNNIQSQRLVQPNTVINKRYKYLPLIIYVAFLQFIAETGFINAFQQSWTKRFMNCISRIDNQSCYTFCFGRNG